MNEAVAKGSEVKENAVDLHGASNVVERGVRIR